MFKRYYIYFSLTVCSRKIVISIPLKDFNKSLVAYSINAWWLFIIAKHFFQKSNLYFWEIDGQLYKFKNIVWFTWSNNKWICIQRNKHYLSRGSRMVLLIYMYISSNLHTYQNIKTFTIKHKLYSFEWIVLKQWGEPGRYKILTGEHRDQQLYCFSNSRNCLCILCSVQLGDRTFHTIVGSVFICPMNV